MSRFEIQPDVFELPVQQIVVGEGIQNSRSFFDPDALRELAESIYANGQITPIVVTAVQNPQYGPRTVLVAGERRLRAAKIILEEIDPNWHGMLQAREFVGTLEDARLLNGEENLAREQLDEVDLSAWVTFMIEDLGYTYDDLANSMKKSQEWLTRRVVFHKKGTDKLKQAIRDRVIRFSAAYEMAKKMAPEVQDKRVDMAYKSEAKFISLEEVKEGDETVNKVKRPTAKNLGAVLAKAEKAASSPDNIYAPGVVAALRYCLGIATEEELDRMITWKKDEAPFIQPTAPSEDSSDE